MDEALLSGSPLVKVTISGATGYIGGRLLGNVLDRGWKACAVVRAGDEARLPAGVERIVDPGAAGTLAGQLTEFGPDVVLHLAACQDLTDTPDASDALVEANIGFGARMLSAAHTAGARAFVAAGTYSVHAEGDRSYHPQTLYAASKQAFSALAAYYRAATEMRTVVLELSDTYGPGDTRRKFLDLVDAAARSGEPLDASPGEQVVSPLHLDDVVSAFVYTALTLLGPEAGILGPAHSVAGPRAVTLRELVSVYEEATGRDVPVRWGARPYREREIMEPWSGDALSSWSPNVGLSDGLAAVYGRNPS